MSAAEEQTNDDVFGITKAGWRFVQRGGIRYWEDGETTSARPGVIVHISELRDMGSYNKLPQNAHENYANWTEEYRQIVRDEKTELLRIHASRRLLEEARQKQLLESARAKLTTDEIMALTEWWQSL